LDQVDRCDLYLGLFGDEYGYEDAAGVSPTASEFDRATGFDAHSMSEPPLFADAFGGDYHLQSAVGSWHGGSWAADASNSPCMATGVTS